MKDRGNLLKTGFTIGRSSCILSDPKGFCLAPPVFSDGSNIELLEMFAALIYTVMTSVVIAFHIALLLGAPWGEFALAGKYPGHLPGRARVIVAVEIAVLVMMNVIVLIRAGQVARDFHDISNIAIWGVVVITSVSVVLHLITPSKREKMLWGPVTLIQLICCFAVAVA
ncbi:MAG: hypothetical protein MJA28_04615 [Gammaproteobacteria bacterium]|nr:hypothetical protein [Gammaproteobacteria bacterium]